MEYQPECAGPEHEGHPDGVHGAFARDTEAFYSPKITKVEVTIDRVPNQLYSQGMRTFQQWDETKKLLVASPSSKRHPEVAMVAKDLALEDVSVGEFLTTKYVLADNRR